MFETKKLYIRWVQETPEGHQSVRAALWSEDSNYLIKAVYLFNDLA